MKYPWTFLLGLLLACSTPKDFDWNDTSAWFAFQPGEDWTSSSPVALNGWLDAPAGKHGFVEAVDDVLQFENGTAVKFWGTNICSGKSYVESEEADRYADFLAYYGQNGVRFHKFTWHGYAENISTDLAPEKYDRLDYFHSALKAKGIYTGWSHIYGHRVQPGDSSRLVNYQEIRDLSYPWSHLNGSSASLVNFAPDLQDLSISLTVNMLNHRNPHTGLRYAEDPALAFVEFQNEDNIFWGAIERSLEQAPTYRAMLCEMFSVWLLGKYGGEQAFTSAWGLENIPEGQSLQKQNVYPKPSHGYFSFHYQQSIDSGKPMPTHVLDQMRFLYETQVRFYRKFERAIRQTGYRGVLVGSCWQAGSGISHFYNLHADYLVGLIDRHNYFGGGSGHQMKPTKVKDLPHLAEPGSGLLSLGMQQVVDRPFSISEWMSLPPNEWTAEAAPIIATYGLGLQGWDASFSFATDEPGFSSFVQSEHHGVYNATSPVHVGLYPVLARMVYRQDITESPVQGTRNVHVPSLVDGRLDFEELVRQDYDVKSFTGSVPSEALAIGRFPVQFVEDWSPTHLPDLSPQWNKANQSITSVTGELTWSYGQGQGLITINTEKTKGIIGFPNKRSTELGTWTLSTDNPFAIVLATSLHQNEDLATAREILITTIARSRNTDMLYTPSRDSLISVGQAPLLLEPVSAQITGPDLQGILFPLDHAGRKGGEGLPVDGQVMLDGAKYQTIYYLLSRP